MKESEIESRLVCGIKKLGGRAYKFVSPGNAGVPDRLVVLPEGRIIFVELKTENGKLSALQRVQINKLNELGQDVRVVRGMEGLRRFFEEIEESQ